MKLTNPLVDLLQPHLLACEHGGDVDLLAMHADAPAGGDEIGAVMQGVVDLR
jgi:hypothetical protein